MSRGHEFVEAEGIRYAIRLPANSILQSKIGYLLKRLAWLGDRRTRCAATTPASAIRRRVGRNPGGW
jgi:hypothetical protein